MWTEKEIIQSLRNCYRDLETQASMVRPNIRLFGFAEGLLRCVESIPTNKTKFEYQDIKYKNWFGLYRIRKESYYEMIFRLTKEYLIKSNYEKNK
jgi:hypothetical protein